jgi:hypothetical protein
LFISWTHWVPDYVRTELKNKTGIIVNEYGVRQDDGNNEHKLIQDSKDQPVFAINIKPSDILQQKDKQPKKDYTPIKSYKPSGSLVYNDALLSQMNDKLP